MHNCSILSCACGHRVCIRTEHVSTLMRMKGCRVPPHSVDLSPKTWVVIECEGTQLDMTKASGGSVASQLQKYYTSVVWASGRGHLRFRVGLRRKSEEVISTMVKDALNETCPELVPEHIGFWYVHLFRIRGKQQGQTDRAM
jgi:hypothetical protein